MVVEEVDLPVAEVGMVGEDTTGAGMIVDTLLEVVIVEGIEVDHGVTRPTDSAEIRGQIPPRMINFVVGC